MDTAELKNRTKQFALRVIALCDALPDTSTARVIRNQLLRCGTSVGANYRATCRARSQLDFISKIGITEEETDESLYWQELIVEAGIMPAERLAPLMKETDELLAIFTASGRTAKEHSPIRNRQSTIRNGRNSNPSRRVL